MLLLRQLLDDRRHGRVAADDEAIAARGESAAHLEDPPDSGRRSGTGHQRERYAQQRYRSEHHGRGDEAARRIVRRDIPVTDRRGRRDRPIQTGRVLPISALCNSGPVSEALKAIGVSQTVSVDELLAHTLAKSLESPHAGDLLLRLLDSERHRLTESEVAADDVGKPLSALRQDRDGLVLGLVHSDAVDLGIGEDPVVAAGDRLLVAVPIDASSSSHH